MIITTIARDRKMFGVIKYLDTKIYQINVIRPSQLKDVMRENEGFKRASEYFLKGIIQENVICN